MAAARNRFVTGAYDVLIAELTAFREKTLALPWASDRSVKGHAAIVARDPRPRAPRRPARRWPSTSGSSTPRSRRPPPPRAATPGLPLLPRDALS